MEENHIKKAIQSFLSTERKKARVTYQEASDAMGYADKTGTIRVLTRNRLHIKDTIILMVLCKIKTIRVPTGINSKEHFVIKLKCSSLGKVPDLLSGIKASIREDPSEGQVYSKIRYGIMWQDVANKIGSERQTTFNAWNNRDIEMSLIFAFLELGFPKIEAQTEGASVEFFFDAA